MGSKLSVSVPSSQELTRKIFNVGRTVIHPYTLAPQLVKSMGVCSSHPQPWPPSEKFTSWGLESIVPLRSMSATKHGDGSDWSQEQNDRQWIHKGKIQTKRVPLRQFNHVRQLGPLLQMKEQDKNFILIYK